MPNCDFFAAGTDHKAVLEFVLGQSDCRVFELSSEPDQLLREFRALCELEERYGVSDWSADAYKSILLQLYPVKARGRFVAQRTVLQPLSSNPSFFYSADGWGLVQLYLNSPCDGRLTASHTNHNSKERATAWEAMYPEWGPACEWDWPVVSSFSRRLNRFIHRLAVDRIGPRRILPHAARLHKDGVILA